MSMSDHTNIAPPVGFLVRAPGFLLFPALCAELIYRISRIVILTHRARMHDAPIVFAVTDRVSLMCVGLVVVLVEVTARVTVS